MTEYNKITEEVIDILRASVSGDIYVGDEITDDLHHSKE